VKVEEKMAIEGHRHGQGKDHQQKRKNRWIKSSINQSRNGEASIEDATGGTGTLEV
jgi:hypothetical protein